MSSYRYTLHYIYILDILTLRHIFSIHETCWLHVSIKNMKKTLTNEIEWDREIGREKEKIKLLFLFVWKGFSVALFNFCFILEIMRTNIPLKQSEMNWKFYFFFWLKPNEKNKKNESTNFLRFCCCCCRCPSFSFSLYFVFHLKCCNVTNKVHIKGMCACI